MKFNKLKSSKMKSACTNLMKFKYRPSISDENVVPDFRTAIILSYTPNFKAVQ